jgi:hypothetical protein
MTGIIARFAIIARVILAIIKAPQKQGNFDVEMVGGLVFRFGHKVIFGGTAEGIGDHGRSYPPQ